MAIIMAGPIMPRKTTHLTIGEIKTAGLAKTNGTQKTKSRNNGVPAMKTTIEPMLTIMNRQGLKEMAAAGMITNDLAATSAAPILY
jgi:hypothetical protein